MRKACALWACLAIFSGNALAADPLAYQVKLNSTGIGALDAALAGSAQLVTLREKAPAGPFAVIARARQDIQRLRTALESFGYYAPAIDITINGRPIEDPGLPDSLDALPANATAAVTINLDKGELFHIRQVTLDAGLPAVAQRAFTLQTGDPAVAATIMAAAGAMQTALQEDGYAFASAPAPEAVLVPAAVALDLHFHVQPGPRVNIAAITITGLHRLHETYLRRRLLIKPGQLYQPSKLDAARLDLAGLGVFSGVVLRPQTKLGADGGLPLTLDVNERKLRSVSANIGFSTDLGGSAGVTWTHHDLFGNAEQLNLGASLTGLGGSADKGIGYDVTAQLIQPDFLRRDQTLQYDVGGVKQDLDAYNQTAISAGSTVTRKISADISVSLGVSAIEEQITQEGVTRDYTLFGVPLTGRYDSTGLINPLDDALHGARVTLNLTPTESLGGQTATFVILQASASTYFDLSRLGISRPGSSVVALRGLVGSAQGASAFALPPDQRFYGGGSATVRGFRYQSVGPQFADRNPIGGEAIDAATIEFRQRLWRSIGAVVFADAAQVNAAASPFVGTLHEGVGAGLRYYTPIGPVRVDVAIPLNKQPGGDSLELYLGLGQAF